MRRQLQRALSRAAPHRQYSTPAASASAAAAGLLETFHNRSLIQHQVLDANQLQKLSLTLNRPVLHSQDVTSTPPRDGTPVPPGHHLVYFTAAGLEHELGPDGTDRTFNAHAPYTRRMWAGGRMSWNGELRVGDAVEEHTRLLSAVAKRSKSAGEMVLVEVEKEFRGPRGASVLDSRSWIFRPEIDPSAVKQFTPRGELSRTPTTIRDVPAREKGRQLDATWRVSYLS
jgi:hydroxyacyl-ACP dehydratase HTD2-like protein with hotdog domain